MEDIYNDLENYDDVDLVNQLRTENAELKHKLGECNNSMQQLQIDFDKLSAEFKTLETNYSSLLKIARTEIKRKTDMIANLNIEKDMLVIKAMQGGPRNVQKLVRDVHSEALKPKKKKRNKAGGKDRDAFIKKECERPPSSETSSTATDNNNQMVRTERVMDNTTSSSRFPTNKREVHNPDHMGDGIRSPILDRRVSTLARQRFSKLSSDEEFEDMYSAMEPRSISFRGIDRSRKRVRDDRTHTRNYYNAPGSHDKPSNYPDPFRESFNRSRSNRFSDTDRNINRDKSYNDNERNINRDKYDLHYRKYSPETRRRSVRDYSGDRYAQQHDRHSRLESPTRQRYQHKSRERRPYRSREREEDKQDTHMYDYTDTLRHKIHDEYDEPQKKKPRIDYSSQEDARHGEKQCSKEMYTRESRAHTCQSPDFSHAENESCNESVREIRSTASTIIEDPRLNSSKYVKKNEGDKDVLYTANANEIDLQRVDRSLWNLEEVKVPSALTIKPLEISEEHIEEMEADKPLSIVSMESGEVGSEISDTNLNDFTGYPDINECVASSYEYVSNKNDSKTMHKVKEKEKSPIRNISKDIATERPEEQKALKPARHKLAKSEKLSKRRRTDETPDLPPPRNENKIAIKTRRDSTEKPSILHKLIESVRDIPDTPDKTVKPFTITDEKKLKRIPKLKISNKSEKELIKNTEEKERLHFPEFNKSNNFGTDTSKKSRDKEIESLSEKRKSDIPEKETSKSSDGCNLKTCSELALKNSENQTSKSTEGRELPSLCGLRVSDKTEKEASKSSERKETLSRSEKETSKSRQGKDHKKISILKKIDKPEKETPKSTEEHKSLSSVMKDNCDKEPENNAPVFREFEHRVYSTRNIVEGDLELSDESYEEEQAPLKMGEKSEVKNKSKTKRNRETYKDKNVDSKTRLKKDKEKDNDTKNKFTELFGDSSSLITPEELGLTTKEAHALPADCCPPLCEDALDGIGETATELANIPESNNNTAGVSNEEDQPKPKSKDSKSRTKHKKHKVTENTLIPDDTRHLPLIEATEHNDDITRNQVASEVNLVLSNEIRKEMQKAKVNNDASTSNILIQNEKAKEPVKINKKRKDENRLSTSKSPEEIHLKKSDNANRTENLEANSNKHLVIGDNKENASCNDNSERNISGEMARIFDDTMVPSKIVSVDRGNVNKENLLVIEKAKETSAGNQDGLNLAPVLDEPGLIKTVVISTGIQPMESNNVHCTPLNALATSTPAKQPNRNTASEVDSKMDTTCVNVTIASEDSVSQPEADAPVIRINYKRRRKVMKR